MKHKIPIMLAAFALLAVAGLVVFVATFDIDRLRPLIVSQLEQAIGQPVRLERVSLAWRNGVTMSCRGFAVMDKTHVGSEPLVQVSAASAQVRLWPLLHKQVSVSSVRFDRPVIRLSRDSQGRVNLLGLAAVGSPAAAGRPSQGQERAAVSFEVGLVQVTDGTLYWSDAMTQPPIAVQVSALDVKVSQVAPGRPMEIDVSAAIAGREPNLHGSGRLTLPGPQTPGSVEQLAVTLDRLPLQKVLPPPLEGSPQLQGTLSVKWQGRVSTLDPKQWTRAISGKGTVRLAEGAVTNVNVLRLVFERLSMLPELIQALESRLPPEYQAKLMARDTLLRPIDASLAMESGEIHADELRVQTDTFGLRGKGRANLEGHAEAQGVIQIEPALSAAIVKSVKELHALENREGAIEFPLAVRVQANRMSIQPDLNYVASRVMTAGVADLVGRYLRRSDPKEPQAGEQGTTNAQPDQGGADNVDPLGRLLERALQKTLPPKASSP